MAVKNNKLSLGEVLQKYGDDGGRWKTFRYGGCFFQRKDCFLQSGR